MQIQFRFFAIFARAACRTRRTLAILSLLLVAIHGAAASAFSFDDVAARAKMQAHDPRQQFVDIADIIHVSQ